MNKKPSIVWHMMKWGVASGTVLAMLFLAFFFVFGIPSIFTIVWPTRFDLIMTMGSYGVFFGGISGTILGITEGFILHFIIGDLKFPFTKADVKKQRWPAYASTFFVPFFVIFCLSLLGFQGDIFGAIAFNMVLSIPTLIASIVSVYAAHHYLLRLQSWSSNIDPRKAKAKQEWVDSNRLLDDDSDEGYVIPEIRISEQKKHK